MAVASAYNAKVGKRFFGIAIECDGGCIAVNGTTGSVMDNSLIFNYDYQRRLYNFRIVEMQICEKFQRITSVLLLMLYAVLSYRLDVNIVFGANFSVDVFSILHVMPIFTSEV